MLAFVRRGGVLERIRVDGTDRRQLGSDQRGRYYVRWSPDGRRLSYVVGSDSGGVLHVIDADGSNETQVGTSEGGLADWSHDGTKLFYFAPVGPGDLMVASFDGTAWSESVLLGGPTDDIGPRLSNDGTSLAFLRLAGNAGQVMVIDVDGSGLRSLTDVIDGLMFAMPCWSPDDRSIAALVSAPEPTAFVIVPTDGSAITRTPATGIDSIDACNWQRLAP
jgi:Tol biopolymer transport system component